MSYYLALYAGLVEVLEDAESISDERWANAYLRAVNLTNNAQREFDQQAAERRQKKGP